MEYLQRRCNMIPLSPGQTPQSSKRGLRDSITSDGNSGDKGVNVQVIVRCRAPIGDEMVLSSPSAILCDEQKGLVSVIKNTSYKLIDKTFLFDKVFGPATQQNELFDSAISPIVNEVLEGYNCTIFAYGQTGTGKTYTMEGGKVSKDGEFPSDAGIIPRAVKQIFNALKATNADYRLKITFLELYNEEITDLLTPDEHVSLFDDKSKKPVALMEDGKGNVFIRGLEQEVVHTANEVYKVLEKGSAKKRTADSLLNKQSSRSHTIFSITTHIKERSYSEGDEIIKCGKLNLVDLAGSENILRTGAREGRAKEAGEINKSLLTLGRVINALADHSGHVPYRDSKLTRLLRDSLCGKTKTCIIATVSSSINSLEETLSTLDYAYRAKNIRTRPEVNHKLINSELLKELYQEIDRLRQDVIAAREKNGIYIPQHRYLGEEAEKEAMAEKMKNIELELESKNKLLVELQNCYDNQQQLTAELMERLERTEKEFEQTRNTMFDLESKYRKANAITEENEYFISNLLQSEKAHAEQALNLQAELEKATSEASSLLAKVERQEKLEQQNKLLVQNFQIQLVQQLENLHENIEASITKHEQQLKAMDEGLHAFLLKKMAAIEELLMQVGKLKDMHGSGIKSSELIAAELDRSYLLTFSNVTSELSRNGSSLVDLFKEEFVEIDAIFNDLQSDLSSQEEKLVEYAEQQRESHFRTLQMTRSISEALISFFETLGLHTLSLSQRVEETVAVSGQKLYEFDKEFEEYATFDKKQLLEKVADLLDDSYARKKRLVKRSINGLLDSTSGGAYTLQQGLTKFRDLVRSAKDNWTTHAEASESNYLNETVAVESGKDGLTNSLPKCVGAARRGATHCRNAQESFLGLQNKNMDSVDCIVKEGIEANHMIREKFQSSSSLALEEVELANKSLLSAIENMTKLNHDAEESVNVLITPSFEDMIKLRTDHYHAILKIKENAAQMFGLTNISITISGAEPNGSTFKESTNRLQNLLKESKTSLVQGVITTRLEGSNIHQDVPKKKQ